MIEQNSDNDDGSDLILYKSRGVPGAETPVLLGDNIGRIKHVRAFSTTATTSEQELHFNDYSGSAGTLEWNVDFLALEIMEEDMQVHLLMSKVEKSQDLLLLVLVMLVSEPLIHSSITSST